MKRKEIFVSISLCMLIFDRFRMILSVHIYLVTGKRSSLHCALIIKEQRELS